MPSLTMARSADYETRRDRLDDAQQQLELLKERTRLAIQTNEAEINRLGKLVEKHDKFIARLKAPRKTSPSEHLFRKQKMASSPLVPKAVAAEEGELRNEKEGMLGSPRSSTERTATTAASTPSTIGSGPLPTQLFPFTEGGDQRKDDTNQPLQQQQKQTKSLGPRPFSFHAKFPDMGKEKGNKDTSNQQRGTGEKNDASAKQTPLSGQMLAVLSPTTEYKRKAARNQEDRVRQLLSAARKNLHGTHPNHGGDCEQHPPPYKFA